MAPYINDGRPASPESKPALQRPFADFDVEDAIAQLTTVEKVSLLAGEPQHSQLGRGDI